MASDKGLPKESHTSKERSRCTHTHPHIARYPTAWANQNTNIHQFNGMGHLITNSHKHTEPTAWANQRQALRYGPVWQFLPLHQTFLWSHPVILFLKIWKFCIKTAQFWPNLCCIVIVNSKHVFLYNFHCILCCNLWEKRIFVYCKCIFSGCVQEG